MLNNLHIPQQGASRQSIKLFWDAINHGRVHQFWAQLSRRCFCLSDLDQLLQKVTVHSSYYVGLRAVNIKNIRGTLGKSSEFDAEFNPISERTRSRWLSIAMEKLNGRELPPVELIQVENIYYVRDGHHRISVSSSLGQDLIDAEVTIMLLSQSHKLL
jgi:uncharacterized ParB-like nuclease family protein